MNKIEESMKRKEELEKRCIKNIAAVFICPLIILFVFYILFPKYIVTGCLVGLFVLIGILLNLVLILAKDDEEYVLVKEE